MSMLIFQKMKPIILIKEVMDTTTIINALDDDFQNLLKYTSTVEYAERTNNWFKHRTLSDTITKIYNFLAGNAFSTDSVKDAYKQIPGMIQSLNYLTAAQLNISEAEMRKNIEFSRNCLNRISKNLILLNQRDQRDQREQSYSLEIDSLKHEFRELQNEVTQLRAIVDSIQTKQLVKNDPRIVQ
jgi:hypothetical protein